MYAPSPMHNAPLRSTLQFLQLAKHLFALPFDMAREHYAKAARVGLIEKSLIRSARFDQWLSHMETLLLGPWAR